MKMSFDTWATLCDKENNVTYIGWTIVAEKSVDVSEDKVDNTVILKYKDGSLWMNEFSITGLTSDIGNYQDDMDIDLDDNITLTPCIEVDKTVIIKDYVKLEGGIQ